MTQQIVFFLSDHTGITVEMLGRSLLTQFEGLEFSSICVPYIDDLKKTRDTQERINEIIDSIIWMLGDTHKGNIGR